MSRVTRFASILTLLMTLLFFQNCSDGFVASQPSHPADSSISPNDHDTSPPPEPEPGSEPPPAPTPEPGTPPPPTPSPPTVPKRWFPGHYLYTADDQNHLGMKESRRSLVRTNPYFVGYKNLYWWHRLEPSKDVYNFSMIVTDLDKAHADGKKMIIRLMERSFHGNSRPFPVPQYIVSEYNGVWHDGNKIFIKIWDPAVTERHIKLVEALAKAVDSHPAFQGVLMEESSMSNIHLQPGYTHAKAADYWARLSRRGTAAFKQGIFMMNFNWGLASNSNPTREAVTDEAVLTNKAGIGATDLRTTYTATLTTSFGYVFDRYKGIAPLIANVEWNTYSRDNTTPRELISLGVDRLGLNFIGWDPRTSAVGSGSGDDVVDFNIHDVISEINRQKGHINTVAPKNILNP